jgi:hypothetical protein
LTTPQYGLFWLINTTAVATPPQNGQLKQFLATNFSGHDNNFESTVEIILI